MHVNSLQVPASLLADHRDFRRQLASLSGQAGPLGAVAAEVEQLVDAHARREEALPLPLLALLPSLAAGDLRPDAAVAVGIAREFKRELPSFLEEHIAIVGAVERLFEMGEELDRADVAALARQIIAHAEIEEDILYPAALLVGEVVEHRLLARMERAL